MKANAVEESRTVMQATLLYLTDHIVCVRCASGVRVCVLLFLSLLFSGCLNFNQPDASTPTTFANPFTAESVISETTTTEMQVTTTSQASASQPTSIPYTEGNQSQSNESNRLSPLLISNFSFTYDVFAVGQTLYPVLQVTNRGNATASHAYTYFVVMLDDRLYSLKAFSSTDLNPGQSASTTVDVPCHFPGRYSLSSVSSESERISFATTVYDQQMNITCRGQSIGNPDFRSSIAFSPQPVLVGESFTLTASITNNGDAYALPSNATLYEVFPLYPIGEQLEVLSSRLTSLLAPGASESFTFSLPCEYAGARTFRTVVDPEKNTVEVNETNNNYTLTFNCTVPVLVPDLVTYLTLSHTTGVVGGNVTLNVTTINIGNGTAGQSSTEISITGSVSEREYARVISVPPLAKDEAYTYTLSVDCTLTENQSIRSTANVFNSTIVNESILGNNINRTAFICASA